MQPVQQATSPDDTTSIVPLQTTTVIDEQLVSTNIIPTNQPLSTVSNNSLSPATTTTYSSNDSSTNTSITFAETRPSIIPFSISTEENKQQNEAQESSELTPLPSIHPTPHICEKKLSTASAAPLLQHVLTAATHQPLADIKDLETALSTTLGIHRSVSVAPNFPPFPHVTSTPDALHALGDHPNMFVASVLHNRMENNQAHHEELVVDSSSIDSHAHHSAFNGITNDAPRFSIESSRPTSIHSPIMDQEFCENCRVPLMDNRVFCGLDCAQSFAMMQV